MPTPDRLPALQDPPSPRALPTAVPAPEIVYPDSDGMPMADNTKQFDCIVMIHTGIAAQFRDDPDVFVAGDLLWYPVEGDNKTRIAPDVLVAFGRPKGHRGSYMQWREGGVAPQVVFEIVSPNNTWAEMIRKLRFYERYGVEEYYIYDPDRGELFGWLRREGRLDAIEEMDGWVSPRLSASFQLLPDGALEMRHPDGRRFESAVDLDVRAEAAYRLAQTERDRADRLAAMLRDLGIDPDASA